MRALIAELRIYAAELILNLAFEVMPNSQEKIMLAALIADYGKWVLNNRRAEA